MEILINFFQEISLRHSISIYLALVITIISLATVSILINYICRNYIAYFVNTLLLKTNNHWMTLINKFGVVKSISQLGPAVFLYWSIEVVSIKRYPITDSIINIIKTVTTAYILCVVAATICACVDVIYEHYKKIRASRNKPMKGYAQIFKLLVWFLTAIFSVSILLDKSPWAFLTGLGAISAVLVIVFKDTILGFVANIQVSAYDLVREGDWITIDQHGIDGTVFDISVNTVKVRNFDNTIATIPTYDLVTCNVQNWRGMTESGGRRIKRSIKIDMSTVRFVDNFLMNKLSEIDLIRGKIAELVEQRNNEPIEHRYTVTNIGLFRAYVEAYLQKNENIHQSMTLLVRDLQPTETGMPIEVYAFTNSTVWSHYEAVLADIFEHLLAMLPMFDLKVYQLITGNITKVVY